MSTTSYDATVVGGLRCRASRIILETPPDSLPILHIEQYSAVTMIDTSTQQIAPMPTIDVTLDVINNGNTLIPIVDYNSGTPVLDTNGNPMTTTLNSVMMQMLAVIRANQILTNP